MTRTSAWLIRGENKLKGVSSDFCERLSEKEALRILHDTMRALYYMNSAEWLRLYDIGILNEADSIEDRREQLHLEQGLSLMQEAWPMFEQRVRKRLQSQKW